MQKLKPLQQILMNVFENFETIRGRFSNGLYVQNVYLAQAYSNIERQEVGHQQKVGIQVGRSEKVGFYKGTFRAQTRYDRTFSQFFGPF